MIWTCCMDVVCSREHFLVFFAKLYDVWNYGSKQLALASWKQTKLTFLEADHRKHLARIFILHNDVKWLVVFCLKQDKSKNMTSPAIDTNQGEHLVRRCFPGPELCEVALPVSLLIAPYLQIDARYLFTVGCTWIRRQATSTSMGRARDIHGKCAWS